MDSHSGKSVKTSKVYFLANPDKPDAEAALRELREFAEPRCTVVGSQLGLDGGAAVDAGAEYVVIIGGDGTLIGVARSLGSNQLPLIGINVGKLGFLAEFSVAEFKDHLAQILTDEALIRRRMVFEVGIQQNGDTRSRSIAINDCVIHAGAPFRPISLGMTVSGTRLTEVIGDGLIVSTPSGSTAHNLSAGGPILQPGVEAIVLTPLCPHSLTHRPLVIERESIVEVSALRVNEGTMAIIDGQVSFPLQEGDMVTIRRFGTHMLRVRNPIHARWHNLVTKLHWGRAPNYD